MSKDWSAAKIKYMLDEIGYDLSKVSRESGVGYQSISNALRVKTPTADRAISEILSVEASEIWPSRYDEGVTPMIGKPSEMSDELKQKLVESLSNLPERRRTWSKAKIEQAIKDQGFDDLRAAENVAGFQLGAFGQASSRKNVAVDEAISNIVGVPVDQIFPHRYWVGGEPIPKLFNIDSVSDEQFDKWKSEMGTFLTNKRREGKLKNADGTVDHPFYNEPIHDDVSPRADERQVVKLPPGVKII